MNKSWLGLCLFFCLMAGRIAHADGTEDLDRLLGLNATAKAAVVSSRSDIIRLTPDKTKVLRLDQDAASVIVANPVHASILLDTPRLLVIMPRQPGSTSFTVLDKAGRTILDQEIIVSAVQPEYVRVRRMCNADDASCQPNAYFYCPDGCYEVSTVEAAESNQSIPGFGTGGVPTFENQPIDSSLSQSPTDEEQDGEEPPGDEASTDNQDNNSIGEPAGDAQ